MADFNLSLAKANWLKELQAAEDAWIKASNVTQHQAALTLTESQISDLKAYLLAADLNTLAKLNAIVADATLIDTGDARLSDARTPTAHNHAATEITSGVLADARVQASNVTQHQLALALAAAQITSGTFSDARIQETNVTQHQAALTLTESQISDLKAYLLAADLNTLAKLNAIVADATLIDTADARLSDARTPTAHNHVATEITSGQLLDAVVKASNVTQHQAALTLTESQISDLKAYLLAADLNTLAKLNAIVADATLIDTADARLSDARTPTAHNHAATEITSGVLADARVQASNVTQHQGSIKLDDLGTPDDNTDLDATESLHGLLSKADKTKLNNMFGYAVDSEASDTYLINVSPAPLAYAAGQLFTFKANTANTGAATLNVDTLGNKTIKKNGDQDLADNDIKAGQIVKVIYDGTNFQMLSQLGNESLTVAKTWYSFFLGADDYVPSTAETRITGWTAPAAGKIWGLAAAAQDNAVGANLQMDVEKNGTTILTGGTIFEIASGAKVDDNGHTIADPTSFAAGDVFNIDVDQAVTSGATGVHVDLLISWD